MTKPKLFLILFAMCAAFNYAKPLFALELGNCDTPRYQKELFANADKGKLSGYIFMVEKQGAELHRSNAAPSASGSPGQTETLDLNTMLTPVAIDGVWMQVSRLSEPGKPYGWILKKDLLCAKLPLMADDGPELVFYIKTATAQRGIPETIAVYDHSSGGKKIRELSRFDSYYVMDEQDDRYLLSKAYFIDNSTKLVGWVDKDKGFIWNSFFGMRPAEDLENEAVKAYAEFDTRRQYPIPILGGKQWYKTGLRIPALLQQNGVYKVILPLSGMELCRYEGNNQTVCPKVLITSVQIGQVSKKLCAKLGKQCTQGIHDSTLEGFIDADPKKLSVDVWFTSNSLSEYIQILGSVRKIRDVQYADAKRQKLVFELTKVLEAVIKKPTYEECQDASNHARECTVAEYMSRYGHLPVRAKSPLLRYKFSELKDPAKVPECEITALLRWIDHSYELLTVAQGNRRPVWNSEGKDPECRRADGSLVNNDFPYIAPDSIHGEPFKDSAGNVDYEMGYSHKLEDKLDLYWIPQEFLP